MSVLALPSGECSLRCDRNSWNPRGSLRCSCTRVGPSPTISAMAGDPCSRYARALASDSAAQAARSETAEPEPTPDTTSDLARSGYIRPKCSAAYAPMLDPTTWVFGIPSAFTTAAMSWTTKGMPYRLASPGAWEGG